MRWVKAMVCAGILCAMTSRAWAQTSRPGGGPATVAVAEFNDADGAIAGAPGGAEKIVYLLDATGTMMNVFDHLRTITEKSIDSLDERQSFNIVAFRDTQVMLFNAKGLVKATAQNKQKAKDFIEKLTPAGGGSAEAAIQKAFSLNPQVMQFVSDGLSNTEPRDRKNKDPEAGQKEAVALFAKLNKTQKARINGIYLMSDPKYPGTCMEQIAKDGDGRYVGAAAEKRDGNKDAK